MKSLKYILEFRNQEFLRKFIFRHTVLQHTRVGPFGSNSFALCPLSAVWMVTLRLEKKFNQFEHHSQLQWHQIELHTYDSTTEPKDICLLCAWISGLYMVK